MSEDQNPPLLEPKASSKASVRRCIFACLGVVFVVIAAVGVFLPLIPTVGPLLLASLFLTKSNPAWERKLVRNKLFAKYLHLLDGKNELSQRERIVSIALMWTSILFSGLVITASQTDKTWLLAILVMLGAIGTVFILRFGKRKLVDGSGAKQS